MKTPLYPSFGILLVDDEPAWLRSLSMTLEGPGGLSNLCQCQDSRQVMQILAGEEIGLVLLDLTMPNLSGEELLGSIVEEHPDIMLVILDVVMPTMDGREWLGWFRKRQQECPVIVISAYKFDDDNGSLAPTAILEKPFHVAELLDLVGLFCGLSTPSASVV